ncbi:MAG: hypothetical protein V8R11_04330 [Alphaproteobacteria bacterium]
MRCGQDSGAEKCRRRHGQRGRHGPRWWQRCVVVGDGSGDVSGRYGGMAQLRTAAGALRFYGTILLSISLK